MKELLITKLLKDHIFNIEKCLSLGKRSQFVRTDSHEYRSGYSYNETKGVKDSVVYLYDFSISRSSSDYSKNAKSSIGFSFNYLDESESYKLQIKLPIKEQKMRFSYLVDKTEGDEPVYSDFFEIEEARSKLRELVFFLKERAKTKKTKLDFNDYVAVFERIFMSFTTDLEISSKESFLEHNKDLIEHIENEKEKYYSFHSLLNSAKKRFNTEIKASNEQINVLKLEKELLKAKSELAIKKNQISKELNITTLESKAYDSNSKWRKTVKTSKQKANEIALKLGIPTRFTKIIDKHLIIDEEKKKGLVDLNKEYFN